jgi:hypothetical protein
MNRNIPGGLWADNGEGDENLTEPRPMPNNCLFAVETSIDNARKIYELAAKIALDERTPSEIVRQIILINVAANNIEKQLERTLPYNAKSR